VDTTFESRVWQKALDQGILSTAQVNECLRESNSDAPTLRLTEVLVSKGYLDADQVTRIRGELAFAEPEAPEEVRAAARDPRKLIGRYVVVDELGRGGMGIVYKAWDGDLRRFVALKVLSGPWDDEDLARFRREAQSAAGLNHPNIITVFEVSTSDDSPYIALELVDGKTLDGRKLTAPKAAELMITIARAVDVAHKRGLIHRDLKPSNIMIDAKGSPRVMDFGLAKAVRSSSQITVSGTVVGTPAYMSPEQAQGRVREMDKRSDIFSLGAMLYELLTGEAPFRGKTPLETLTAVVACKPLRPTKLAPSVPKPLEAILLRCLHKEPSGRYPSCEALARDLERFLKGEKVRARIPWAVPGPAVFALSAGIAFAAGLVVVFWPATPPPPAPAPAPRPVAPAKVADRSQLDRGLRLLEEARLDLYRPGIQRSAIVLKLRDAETCFDAALKADPDSGAAWLGRGEAKSRLNRFEDALPDFAEAARRLPTSPAVHLSRGRFRLELYSRELGWVKTDLSPDARRWRDEARADFMKARELSAAQNDLPHLQTCLAIADENYAEAVRLATTAIPQAERPEEFHKLRGDAYAALAARELQPDARAGLVQKCVADYGDAIRLRHHFPDAYRLRGAALWHLGRTEEAHRDFKTVLDADPDDSRALSDMGIFYIQTGRVDLARDYLDRAIAADGRNYRARTTRATIWLGDKLHAQAKDDLEKALKVNPDHLPALFNLAVAFHKLKDRPEALRRLDEFLRKSPKSSRALYQRAVIYYEGGQWKEALDDFAQAVEIDPAQEPTVRPYIDHCRVQLRKR
jgi:tetratricopeptide (TPR) repeat protein